MTSRDSKAACLKEKYGFWPFWFGRKINPHPQRRLGSRWRIAALDVPQTQASRRAELLDGYWLHTRDSGPQIIITNLKFYFSDIFPGQFYLGGSCQKAWKHVNWTNWSRHSKRVAQINGQHVTSIKLSTSPHVLLFHLLPFSANHLAKPIQPMNKRNVRPISLWKPLNHLSRDKMQIC